VLRLLLIVTSFIYKQIRMVCHINALLVMSLRIFRGTRGGRGRGGHHSRNGERTFPRPEELSQPLGVGRRGRQGYKNNGGRGEQANKGPSINWTM